MRPPHKPDPTHAHPKQSLGMTMDAYLGSIAIALWSIRDARRCLFLGRTEHVLSQKYGTPFFLGHG